MNLKEKLICAVKSNAIDLKESGSSLQLWKNNKSIWVHKVAVFETVTTTEKYGLFNIKTREIESKKFTGYTYEIKIDIHKYSLTEQEFNDIHESRKKAKEKEIEEELDKLCKVK